MTNTAVSSNAVKFSVALLMIAHVSDRGIDRSEIIAQWRERDLRMLNLRVVTEMADELPGRPEGAFLRGELRARDQDSFSLDSSHGDPSSPWQSDYSRSRSYIVGTKYVAEKPAKRTFIIDELVGNEFPERFAEHPFFFASGWWPEESKFECPTVLGCSTSIRAVLCDDRYALADDTNGEDDQLVIIERLGVDRITLNRSFGLALVQRELYNNKGERILGLFVEEFQESAAGLYSPSRWRIVLGVAANRDPESATGVDERRVVVTECELDANIEEDFQYVPPPGAFFIDRRKEGVWRQAVPGGLDVLESVGERLAAEYHATTQAGTSTRILSLAGSVVLGVLAGAMCGRYSRVRWHEFFGHAQGTSGLPTGQESRRGKELENL